MVFDWRRLYCSFYIFKLSKIFRDFREVCLFKCSSRSIMELGSCGTFLALTLLTFVVQRRFPHAARLHWKLPHQWSSGQESLHKLMSEYHTKSGSWPASKQKLNSKRLKPQITAETTPNITKPNPQRHSRETPWEHFPWPMNTYELPAPFWNP